MAKAKKPRTEKQLAADRKRSRAMKGTNPFGNKKRRSRKSRSTGLSNQASPRRRRKMAKGKKGGGRRKGIQITPLRIVKGLTVLAGAKMVADTDVVNLVKHHIARPGEITSNPVAAVKEYALRVLPGVIVATVGPKLEEKTVQVFSKGEPMIGKLARTTLVKV